MEPKIKKKRILFIVTQSEMGGAQRFLLNTISRLNKDIYEIGTAVGSDGDGELLNKLDELGIAFEIIENLKRNASPIKDFFAVFETRRLIMSHSPDTVFLCSSKAGFIGSLACRMPTIIKDIKVVYRIGGWQFNDPRKEWQNKIYLILERLSAHWKDVIILNNIHDYNQAVEKKIRPREKIEIIHGGIDTYKMNYLPREEARLKMLERASKQSGKVFQADYIVGTIANFYPSKGLGHLLDAAQYLKAKINVVFFVIGDGEKRIDLQTEILKKGLEKNVFLLGRMPEAYKFLTGFDIFVSPSLKEGFPWSILEAMAAKLPVIATQVGGVPEIIKNGHNGFIVKPGDGKAIAEKIKELIANDHLRQELSIKSHQTVLFDFTLDKMVSRIESLL
ncbi:MAG: Glycosyltransferase, group 1 family [Candidatus Yanofskybacteria bacterium GW2011_GWA2_44_10]|nr:MAG: Glycosyltransferase, group 1 family [Candidatus Yanofskybacteria bacterium GW2011_GWA2_44_10]